MAVSLWTNRKVLDPESLAHRLEQNRQRRQKKREEEEKEKNDRENAGLAITDITDIDIEILSPEVCKEK